MVKYLLIACVILLCSSCGSFLYSPGLSLTKEAVQKGDYTISGGAGTFPETRPHAIRAVTAGYYLSAGYGFTDRVSLHVTGWGALQSYAFMGFRSGYSGHFRLVLRQSERSRFELVPRGAFVMHKNTIGGYGFGLTGVYVQDLSSALYFYAGGGPAVGYQDPYSRVPGFNPDGSAMIGHLGLGLTVVKGLSVVFELNPLYSLNFRDDMYSVIFPGTLSLAWHLKERKP